MTQISIVIYLTTGAALSMGYFELLYILLALVSRCRRIVDTALAAEQGVPAQMASPDQVYGPDLVTR